MTDLKAAILRSQQQRILFPNGPQQVPAPPCPPSLPDLPAVAPGSIGRAQQLASLRRRFESKVQHQAPRFEDGRVQWLQGSTRPRRRSDKPHACDEQQQGGGSVLTAELETDIMAVLTEARLSPRTIPAVLSAARKGIITNNPGLLLCQLLRYLSCLDGSCLGRRQAMSLLAVYPVVLNAAPDTLAWHLEELSETFGDKAAAMVTKRPALVCASPFTVWSNLEALARLLDTSVERAQALVARQPRLLLNSTLALSSRLNDLQDVTGLGLPAVRTLVISQPALLTYHPATLAQNMECMADSLGAHLDQVSKVVSRAPSLLMLNQDTLRTKLGALGQALMCDATQASALVLRQPSVLGLSTDVLATKCDQLAHVLSTTRDQACDLARSNPALLTLAPGTVQRKLTCLEGAVREAEQLTSTDQWAAEQLPSRGQLSPPSTSLPPTPPSSQLPPRLGALPAAHSLSAAVSREDMTRHTESRDSAGSRDSRDMPCNGASSSSPRKATTAASAAGRVRVRARLASLGGRSGPAPAGVSGGRVMVRGCCRLTRLAEKQGQGRWGRRRQGAEWGCWQV